MTDDTHPTAQRPDDAQAGSGHLGEPVLPLTVAWLLALVVGARFFTIPFVPEPVTEVFNALFLPVIGLSLLVGGLCWYQGRSNPD